jgi:hypothetical protein
MMLRIFNKRVYRTLSLLPAGIDTLSIRINPYLINNVNHFHKRGNVNNSRVTARYSKQYGYYSLDFQAEFFWDTNDYASKICTYIQVLMEEDILKKVIIRNDTPLNTFLLNNFHSFFAITRLDFYFDFKDTDFEFAPINKKLKRDMPTTRYSKDYKVYRRSTLKSYDRRDALKSHTNIPHAAIDKMQYPYRIEFSFFPKNCNYLHISNLIDNYDMIFNRFKGLMAQKWDKFGNQVAIIPNWFMLNYGGYFADIQYLLNYPINRNSNVLAVSPKNPIPSHTAKKNEVDKNFMPRFSTME